MNNRLNYSTWFVQDVGRYMIERVQSLGTFSPIRKNVRQGTSNNADRFGLVFGSRIMTYSMVHYGIALLVTVDKNNWTGDSLRFDSKCYAVFWHPAGESELSWLSYTHERVQICTCSPLTPWSCPGVDPFPLAQDLQKIVPHQTITVQWILPRHLSSCNDHFFSLTITVYLLWYICADP